MSNIQTHWQTHWIELKRWNMCRRIFRTKWKLWKSSSMLKLTISKNMLRTKVCKKNQIYFAQVDEVKACVKSLQTQQSDKLQHIENRLTALQHHVNSEVISLQRQHALDSNNKASEETPEPKTIKVSLTPALHKKSIENEEQVPPSSVDYNSSWISRFIVTCTLTFVKPRKSFYSAFPRCGITTKHNGPRQ